MCGLLADGSKASGFKSMVVAQYTGIGLQKDNNAFIKYDEASGIYLDSTDVANLSSNSRSVFKPSYENYHIKYHHKLLNISCKIFKEKIKFHKPQIKRIK